MKTIKYVVITPVRDEERYIERTINSLIHQTVRPAKWVIVDDGSTDSTPNIIDYAAESYPWIIAIHRFNRGFRKSGGGVVEAFYDGYPALEKIEWDFIVKLDGDLSFSPDYFKKCFEHFENDPSLGIAGGLVLVKKNGVLTVDSVGDPPFHVRGATKIYRRACWMQVAPLVRGPGWDTIDEVKANMLNWRTQTFDNVSVVQHKATGSADGNWYNWFKNGQGSYITGYHPVFMMAKCLKRLLKRPYIVPAVALWAGYLIAHIKGKSKLSDREVIKYLRKEQMKRLMMRPSIYK